MRLLTQDRRSCDVRVELIDDPELPSRATMDDEQLEQLAASIRDVGLIEPMILFAVGDRFQVIAGHRRLIACKRAGLEYAPCVVYPERPAQQRLIQAHENARREALNPAEEALWFAELLDVDCDGDIDKLAGIVGETVNYIDGRLSLVRGDERVFDALKRGTIKLGAAHELNKCEDAYYRKYFLDCAERSGANVTTIAGWILDWKKGQAPAPPQQPQTEPDAPGMNAAPHDPFTCYVCRKANNVHLIRQINVHEHCKLAILDPMLNSDGGGQ